MVNEQGGMPTAWVENLGNDIATLDVRLFGLPNDWIKNAPNTIVIAPGQILGLPFDIVPPSDWDGQSMVVNFEIEHPSLGISSMAITVENSSFSFSSSPVLSGISDRNMTIDYNGDLELTSQDTNIDFSQDSGLMSITLPSSRMNFTLSDPQDSSLEYVIHLDGRTLPEVTGNCNLEVNSFENLGMVPISGKVGQCQLFSSNEETLRGTIILISNSGIQVPISDSGVVLGKSQNQTIDINLSSWSTDAGTIELELMFIDNYGRIIAEDAVTVVSRSSGWNIGIANFNADGDIKIDISRTEYNRLIGVTCKLKVSAATSNWEETLVVDIGGLEFAPKLVIDDPGDLVNDGEKLTAVISCASPYDIDDNPEDDISTTTFSKSSTINVGISDVIVAIGISIVLVVIAFFAGLLQVREDQSEKKIKQSSEKIVTEIEQIEEVESIEEIDDFSMEFDEDLENISDDVIDLDEETTPSVDEEIVRELDTSASGRLASLRDELDDENIIEKRPIKDRMDEFFNR
tara:strand:- start:437 stop:1987 length:1551 start_codon:yes stop_codon:yes gene_type:complete